MPFSRRARMFPRKARGKAGLFGDGARAKESLALLTATPFSSRRLCAGRPVSRRKSFRLGPGHAAPCRPTAARPPGVGCAGFDPRHPSLRRHADRSRPHGLAPLMAGSAIRVSNLVAMKGCGSLLPRCQPGHGPSSSNPAPSAATLATEPHGVIPTSFDLLRHAGEALSADFHAEPVVLAGRRHGSPPFARSARWPNCGRQLVRSRPVGLAGLLTNHSGSDSGFMIAQVHGRLLSFSENKHVSSGSRRFDPDLGQP